MFGLFYIDQDGNYGEADGLIILHPDSVPDEWRDKIGDAMDEPRPELLKVVNEYCSVNGISPSPIIDKTPYVVYSVGYYAAQAAEFKKTSEEFGLSSPAPEVGES